MYIHDDADAATIVVETVSALIECARSVGKLGLSLSVAQIEEMKAAMRLLQKALDLKRGLADT